MKIESYVHRHPVSLTSEKNVIYHNAELTSIHIINFITILYCSIECNIGINFSHSTRLLAATTLRNVLGTKNLSEILSERETISHQMQSSLDDATDPWGVKVERVEM